MEQAMLVKILAGMIAAWLVVDTVTKFRDPDDPGLTRADVELILEMKDLETRFDSIINEHKILILDYERISHDIEKDSIDIANSSRAYRDSLRAILFE